jgi:hypothetical protein
MGDPRVEQDTFCGGGLPGIDVRHDPNIARMFQIWAHNCRTLTLAVNATMSIKMY